MTVWLSPETAASLGEPNPTSEVLELAEYHKANCNRYTNGQCSSRICLVRGGWQSGPPDYTTATCAEHETITALATIERLSAERLQLREALEQITKAGSKAEAFHMALAALSKTAENGEGGQA